MYADVSRAYFYARAKRPVYVKLPAEDMTEGDENKCGKLLMSMYGTRDAALNWSLEYSDTLRAAGYEQGKSNTHHASVVNIASTAAMMPQASGALSQPGSGTYSYQPSKAASATPSLTSRDPL